jgi:hypothetical protein
LDPFEEPECEAEDVFVFEMNCIGRGLKFLLYFLLLTEVIAFATFADVFRWFDILFGRPDFY